MFSCALIGEYVETSILSACSTKLALTRARIFSFQWVISESLPSRYTPILWSNVATSKRTGRRPMMSGLLSQVPTNTLPKNTPYSIVILQVATVSMTEDQLYRHPLPGSPSWRIYSRNRESMVEGCREEIRGILSSSLLSLCEWLTSVRAAGISPLR